VAATQATPTLASCTDGRTVAFCRQSCWQVLESGDTLPSGCTARHLLASSSVRRYPGAQSERHPSASDSRESQVCSRMHGTLQSFAYASAAIRRVHESPDTDIEICQGHRRRTQKNVAAQRPSALTMNTACRSSDRLHLWHAELQPQPLDIRRCESPRTAQILVAQQYRSMVFWERIYANRRRTCSPVRRTGSSGCLGLR
jgi:hypothetical protein